MSQDKPGPRVKGPLHPETFHPLPEVPSCPSRSFPAWVGSGAGHLMVSSGGLFWRSNLDSVLMQWSFFPGLGRPSSPA